MPSRQEKAEQFLKDLYAGKISPRNLPKSLRKKVEAMMKAAKAGQTTPTGAPILARNLGIDSGERIPPGKSIVPVKKPPTVRGTFEGGPIPGGKVPGGGPIVLSGGRGGPGGQIVPFTGGPPKTPPYKPGLLARAGAAIKAHPVKAGIGGGVGLLLAMGLKGQIKSRMKRAKQGKAIRGLPPATIDAVLRARRQQQMLATKRGMLMRNDPEAFQLLMMGLSGEQPQALAKGEVLLGRQPQIAPQAAQDVESLLAAMG